MQVGHIYHELDGVSVLVMPSQCKVWPRRILFALHWVRRGCKRRASPVCVCADSLCTVLGVVCRYWVPPDVDATLQPVVIPCLREGDVFSPALLLLMVAA